MKTIPEKKVYELISFLETEAEQAKIIKAKI